MSIGLLALLLLYDFVYIWNNELCLEKIWLCNLQSVRVDAGSCVMHLNILHLYSYLCVSFFSLQGTCTCLEID